MCVFCKIIRKEVPADIIFEDGEIMAFNDIDPKAPIHVLVIPKKHIESVNSLKEEDKELIGKMVLVARDIARKKGVSESGYRLLLNTGRDAGQTVDHIHLHIIGGTKLPFA